MQCGRCAAGSTFARSRTSCGDVDRLKSRHQRTARVLCNVLWAALSEDREEIVEMLVIREVNVDA